MVLKCEHPVGNQNIVRSLVPPLCDKYKSRPVRKVELVWGSARTDPQNYVSEEQYSDNGTVHHEEFMDNAVQFCKEQFQ